MSEPKPVAETIAFWLLERAVEWLPLLGETLADLVHGASDDVPLVPRLREILPVEGAAARAARALERR
ncbi:MAG: hypothetical protein QOG85_857 [Gaiellaceae bacterium]|nr:hypothetical protein [Gaiellaceae bacterium]